MTSSNARFKTALHALAVVAYLPRGEATSDKVAASVATDPSAARRLLSTLRKAGLLTSSEGRTGGYALAREPADIRLDAVFLAVSDGSLFKSPDRRPNRKCPVGSRIYEVIQPRLDDAQGALLERLARHSLADVMADLA